MEVTKRGWSTRRKETHIIVIIRKKVIHIIVVTRRVVINALENSLSNTGPYRITLYRYAHNEKDKQEEEGRTF